MTDIRYTKIDPSGNITLIVDSFVERSEQWRVAAQLMALDDSVEQVGFIERAEDPCCAARLQMMGGEFCGNASLSAAAFLLRRAGSPANMPCQLPLEVSGAPEAVKISGEFDESGVFSGSVSMPLPESLSEAELLDGFDCCTLPLVRFPGICHAIVENGAVSRAAAQKCIAAWCRTLGTDALGLMFLDAGAGTLEPLVYVASTDTAVWEGSCASGTCAAAAYLAERSGDVACVTLKQPRGTLSASAQFCRGQISSLVLNGSAVVCGEYTVVLP